jgi:hypothetical protein
MVAVTDVSDDLLYGITFSVEKLFSASHKLKYDEPERPDIGLGGQLASTAPSKYSGAL